MARTKIVLIGAGSIIFGPATVRDILLSPALRGSEIVLVDVDEAGLQKVLAYARSLNEMAGAGCRFSATTDRRRALPGADFVVVSVAVERERLWKLDWEIPLKHGIKHVLGENGGPGGLSHALRNIPLILSIARDVEELAPQAWLLNFTNPMSRVCLALARHTRVKAVGLCHQIGYGYRLAARVLDLPVERLAIRAAGLNHFTWILSLTNRETGEDLYPEFRRRIAQTPDVEPLSQELDRIFGLFPATGDGHAGEYVGFAWKYMELTGYDWAGYQVRLERVHREVERIGAGDEALGREALSKDSGERAVALMEALSDNLSRHEDALNLVNRGAIYNMPATAVVEVPAHIANRQISGEPVGALPAGIAALCRREHEIQDLVVQAAVQGDRQAALQALVLDPVVPDSTTARAVLDELLRTHAAYLPQFA